MFCSKRLSLCWLSVPFDELKFRYMFPPDFVCLENDKKIDAWQLDNSKGYVSYVN